MRKKGFVVAILLTAFVAGFVAAEEVIYFTNGTVMPIRSHVVEGEQIKVDLGENGFMAFPKSVVDRIEEAPDVILMPSTSTNKMFASDPSTRVFGASPRQSSGSWQLPTQMDDDGSGSNLRAVGGVVTAAPYPGEDHPALRDLRITNVPEARGANQGQAKKPVPGMPTKLETPSVKQKKVFTEFKSRD